MLDVIDVAMIVVAEFIKFDGNALPWSYLEDGCCQRAAVNQELQGTDVLAERATLLGKGAIRQDEFETQED